MRMPTKLTNRVTRETQILHNGIPIAVTLDPEKDGNGDEKLIFGPVRGKKWTVSLPLSDAFEAAMLSAKQYTPDEIAVMKGTKAKIMINPRFSGPESQAICNAIDIEVARAEESKYTFPESESNEKAFDDDGR